jgi:hypothetical protein
MDLLLQKINPSVFQIKKGLEHGNTTANLADG